WCAVPRACRPGVTWAVHRIDGKAAPMSRVISHRHFRAMSTNWAWTRWSDVERPRDGDVSDPLLVAALHAAGM
ncbi:hypothetical protein, partial [Mycobacterium tuberculosis]|uniref:hypothetical protein n=1 Tax=Mycobacterium tuberculosis TaxID=1773 RepID=UPI001AE3A3B7